MPEAESERMVHLCVCGAEWVSRNHARCEACGRTRHDYSMGYQAGYEDALNERKQADER